MIFFITAGRTGQRYGTPLPEMGIFQQLVVGYLEQEV